MADSNSKSIVIAITGGRDYTPIVSDYDALYELIRDIAPRVDNWYAVNVVHGSARGTDIEIAQWAARMRFGVIPCPIDPALDGTDRRYMGFNRNERMLTTYRPVALIAFPGGYGTEDCIRRAKRKGIKVYCVGQV